VDFYVQQYIKDDDLDLTHKHTEYWEKAMQVEDEANFEAEQGNLTRRLLSPRDRQRRLQASYSVECTDCPSAVPLFNVPLGAHSSLSASQGGALGPECLTVDAVMDNPTSPWKLDGSLALGRHCVAPANVFTVDGRVRLTYGWGMKKDFKLKVVFWSTKISFQCGLSLYGEIGGRSGQYSYDCGRRLDGSTSNLTHPEENAKEEDAVDEVEKDVEEDEVSEFEENLEKPSGSMTEASPARRLSSRRRRRRRRRMCPAYGFEVYANIGLDGGCSVSRRRIGVTLSGGLGLTLGPWPKPLDARAKGTVTAKGCIKIGPFSGCMGLPSITLFDVGI